MGKPTNEKRLEHEQLSKYFKRDSEIYTNFEKITEELNKEKIIKLFIRECGNRTVSLKFKVTPRKNTFFQELYNISKDKHDYFSVLWEYTKLEVRTTFSSHSVHFHMDKTRLINIFGKERANELWNNDYPIELYTLVLFLTIEEKEILRQSISKNPLGTRTLILKESIYNSGGSCHRDTSNKNSFLTEIDFTQPLEEIEKYIKCLHGKYHKNELPNMYDFLNIERKATNQKEIYKTNGHKDFNILLADKLFIYDSVTMGLTREYARKEIIEYHTEIKKFSKDEISKNTIRDYLSTMVDLIENDGLRKYSNSFTS